MYVRKLIVNADDFGQSQGINKGIIQGHEQGIVTSASLMVRYPAAVEAAIYAKGNPALDVGLHVDLGEWMYSENTWVPLYEVVSLDDPGQVKDEVIRQLASFYALMGCKPTHIDSHQHVHLKETICPVLMDIACKLNVTLRRCSQRVKYCGDFYGQHADGSPYDSAISAEALQTIILKLPEGITEMACHPGLDDDIRTMYGTERSKEVHTLCNKEVKQMIEMAQIELCSFDNIPYN